MSNGNTPKIGDTRRCAHCGERIEYVSSSWGCDSSERPAYWIHSSKVDPTHPAIPVERHHVEIRLDLDAIERRIRLAHQKVSALCHGDERWTMRVPADETYDHDLIISAALRDADKMLIALRSLLEQKEAQ